MKGTALSIAGMLFFMCVPASWSVTSWAADTCSDGVGRASVTPVAAGDVVLLPPSLVHAALLIEERGSDLQYRIDGTGAFHEIASKPPRLGVAAISGASSIEVRIVPGQAGGVIVSRPACDAEELAFFADLERRYTGQIERDAATASASIADLEILHAKEDRPIRRAWLVHALANARYSAGLHAAAADTFVEARDAWLIAGDPARAAVAWMAAGEDASRAGRYDEAEERFGKAADALSGLGLAYYELRIDSAQCLLKSRRGDVVGAIACDEAVLKRFEALGEWSEAGVRGISLANLWMKRGDFARSRELLLHVDERSEFLPTAARVRLGVAFGNLYSRLGDLDAAMREFGEAAALLGESGLPKEQADVDTKLARIARLAGAQDEEIRLLRSVVARLRVKDSPDVLATASLRLAHVHATREEAGEVRAMLDVAAAACASSGSAECRDALLIERARLAILIGDLADAKARYTAVQAPDSAVRVPAWQLVGARLVLAEGRPADAVRDLSRVERAGLEPGEAFELASLTSRGLLQSGQVEAAAQPLMDGMKTLVAQTSRWPSAALRSGARVWIAKYQRELFDVAASPAAQQAGMTTSLLRDAIAGGVPRRSRESPAGVTRVPDAIRDAMSRAIIAGTDADQRALFVALATVEPLDQVVTHDRVEPLPIDAGPGDELVLLPLSGTARFRLYAVIEGESRVCMDVPRGDYESLASRFERALNGHDADIAVLDLEAARWHAAVAACAPGDVATWRVVVTPGTNPLPWSWIAARTGEAGRSEPAVVLQLDPSRDVPSRTAVPVSLAILALDLPGTRAALPFAGAEASRVRSAASSIAPGGLGDIDVSDAGAVLGGLKDERGWVHVIGHGQPPSRGSLYAGLWLPGRQRPLLLTYAEIASTPMRADMVVLSACGGPTIDAPAGASRMTLAAAFIEAGVRTVVSASNPASDSASAFWAPLFYEEALRTGDAPSAAKLVRERLRSSPHYRNPRFWAGIDVIDKG